MSSPQINSAALYGNPLFGVSVTVLLYVIATAAHRRWNWAHALLGTCGGVIAVLLIARIPYEQYNVGGSLITFFLGPATVALGVPFYRNAKQIGRQLPRIGLAVTAGTVTSMLSGATVVWLTHGPRSLVLSMIPRGVTTPIAIQLAQQLGGVPTLTAIFTGLSGLLGSLIGPELLHRFGVRGDMAVGAAMGTSSHGIGTARVLRDSDLQGGVSAVAMAVSGILTALLTIPIAWWVRGH